ncbi:ABC transporter substrate-binding protein [Polaromonas sp.]|uniref:ABC transporter substrate-binding protein n=1 Tax=Polaromonas sp. TaxID=1869339 RepID=UPI002FC8FB99
MKRRTLLVGHLGVAGLATFHIPAQAEPGVGERTLLLGQSTVLSGAFRELGHEYRGGALLWFKHLNGQGGVHGRQIELRSIDDGYDPERAVANTRKLLEEDGVFAFFGQFGTGITRATLPLTTAVGVPLFAPYTGADALRDNANRYLFHLRATYGQETWQIVDHLMTTGVRRIAVVHQADGFGQSGLEGARKALRHHGLEPAVTGEMRITPTVEVERAVTAISAARPQAVIMITSGKGAVAFIRRCRDSGVSTQFYGMSVVSSRELAADLGTASRGVVISQVVPSPWRTLAPVALEYQRIGARQDGFAPGYGSFEGFIAAKVFTEGLRRAGPALTREKLVSALETLKDFDIGGLRINYGAGRREGSSFVELSMLSLNGEFVR